MRTNRLCRVLALMLTFMATASVAGTGLQVDPDTVAWPRWKVRLHLGLVAPDLSAAEASVPRSARVLGDYYFSSTRLGNDSGVRLTSGVMVGPRDALFDPVSQPATLRQGLLTVSRTGAMAQNPDMAFDAVVARPYLGVGYSGGNLRAGWGFNADLGLAAQNPGAIRLGRILGGGQNLDDLLRELRLQPVLQLGVNYAF